MTTDTDVHPATPRRAAVPYPRLRVPLAATSLVMRPRLLELLGAHHDPSGAGPDVTFLCAPAGSGKTTLLAEWAQRLRRRGGDATVAWVSLESSDNDVHQLWSAVLDAIDAGAGEDSPVAGLDAPSHDFSSAFLSAFTDAMDRAPHPGVPAAGRRARALRPPDPPLARPAAAGDAGTAAPRDVGAVRARPAAPPAPAGGTRARDRREAARLHARRGHDDAGRARRAARPRGPAGPARANRGLGGRPPAGRHVARPRGGPVGAHRELRQQRPGRGRLPGRRGAGPAAGTGPAVPAGDLRLRPLPGGPGPRRCRGGRTPAPSSTSSSAPTPSSCGYGRRDGWYRYHPMLQAVPACRADPAEPGPHVGPARDRGALVRRAQRDAHRDRARRRGAGRRPDRRAAGGLRPGARPAG